MAEQSVGHVQVSGGIEMIEGGDHGDHVTVVDAGVLHCYQNVGLDLAGAHKPKDTPAADGRSFNRLILALSQGQPVMRYLEI